MEIYLRGVELAVRGGVAEEPPGRHALVGRGEELPALFAHLERRADCEALLVIAGSPVAIPSAVRERLRGRVLVADGRDAAGLAGWLLPVPAIVLAAGAGTRMGGGKMLRPLAGRPLVGWAVEAATDGGADGVW
ncbi:MAG: NTP transferase domain-containing protein, partial [Candidatus Dormibacteraceae bacterium]